MLYIFLNWSRNIKVSNPLTIIAIFAGLSETLATVALVKLPPEIQSVFVYFVMAFPAAIVLLFFLVLYFKNTVLYAPSDFENQTHYLEANEIKQGVNSQLDKLFARVNEGGVKLSEEYINETKSNIEKTVDMYASLSFIEKGIFNSIKANADYEDIRDKYDLSRPAMNNYLSQLEAKGLIVNRVSNGAKWSVNV